ncbi:MAG TPA: hypothetical protein VN544_10705 [Gaiellaceae bacterium]|nr:hypothetical protein [Gaiellaceae bacterium]
MKTREFLESARMAAFQLERSGAEPWVPSNYPAFLAIADEVLDASPDHLRPILSDLMEKRASAHAALQRISERERSYVAAGCFADGARYTRPGELLFSGPSLYSRSAGYVSVAWGLSADERRFAEESFDDYEVLVDARHDLSRMLLRLSEEPPAVGFSLQVLMEHADDDSLKRVPVSDLFASRQHRDERRLLKYLKTFDTARKVENRREELWLLFQGTGVRAPDRGACPGFDDVIALITANEVSGLYDCYEKTPDQREREYAARAFAELFRASLHEERPASVYSSASRLIDWDRHDLPVLAESMLDEFDKVSRFSLDRSREFDVVLRTLRDAPSSPAAQIFRDRVAAKLMLAFTGPVLVALRVLPDAESAGWLGVANGTAHLLTWPAGDEPTAVCGVALDDERDIDPEDWARILTGRDEQMLCSACRRTRWPHALQQLSPTPGLDQASHDALKPIVDAALQQAIERRYWRNPSQEEIVAALVEHVGRRLEHELLAQGSSIHEHALKRLDELPDSYLKQLERLAEAGADLSPPVEEQRDAWVAFLMAPERFGEMAFWYKAICHRSGESTIGTPSRYVHRDDVSDLPHRRTRAAAS